MKRLATCKRADPTTCFEASKAHILIGRCGLSLHLLYTRDSKASSPRAACMKRAKGPRSLHSPFSAPGPESFSDPCVLFAAAVMVARVDGIDVAISHEGDVKEASEDATAFDMVGDACATSSGSDIRTAGSFEQDRRKVGKRLVLQMIC